MSHPTAFTSYSWDDDDHRAWVAKLAERLRNDGVDVKLDKWHAIPGDQLPAFMEREIRTNAFVLIVCTPNYKKKSDSRKGGVGYEGDIMTAEVLTTQNHRKFIPILARGSWREAAPSWLAGKYYVDLSEPATFERQYHDLHSTITDQRPVAPPLGPPSQPHRMAPVPATPVLTAAAEQSIRIVGIVVDEVTEPSMDGTAGSALYSVPFKLSRRPSREWSEIFLHEWDHPRQFTLMHRPGIAEVSGDRIVLDGTTIDEVKRYHRDTLVLCVDETNRKEAEYQTRLARQRETERKQSEQHRKQINDSASDIQF
ncbi:MAG: hypothetical protein JWL90_909 [Chthoniobacteraceae bacterium]|nr:hypothetical protein [Chthoniobacteraceae bacterium]